MIVIARTKDGKISDVFKVDSDDPADIPIKPGGPAFNYAVISEEHLNAALLRRRYCMVNDDSGHTYLIPADKQKVFMELMELLETLDEFEDEIEYGKAEAEWAAENFDDMIVNPSMVYFTDPAIVETSAVVEKLQAQPIDPAEEEDAS